MKNNKTKLESLILEEFELYKKEKELLNEIGNPFQLARGMRNFFSRGGTSVKIFKSGSDLYKGQLDNILSNARTRRNSSSLTLQEIEQEAIDFLNSIGYRVPGQYLAGLAKGSDVFSANWAKNSANAIFGPALARKPGAAAQLMDDKADELLDAIENIRLTVLEQGKSLKQIIKKINKGNITPPAPEVYELIQLHARYFLGRTNEIQKLLSLFNKKTPSGRKNIFNFFLKQSNIKPGITSAGARSQKQRANRIREKFVGASDDAATTGGAKAGKTTGKSASVGEKAERSLFGRFRRTVMWVVGTGLISGTITQAIASVANWAQGKDPLELAKEIEKFIIDKENMMRNLFGPVPYLSAALAGVTKWALTFFLGSVYTRGFLGLQAAQDIAYAPEGILTGRKAKNSTIGLIDADMLGVYKGDRTPQGDYEYSSNLFKHLYLIDIGTYLGKLKTSRSERDQQAIADEQKKEIEKDVFKVVKAIKERWEREIQGQLDSGKTLAGDRELFNLKWEQTMKGAIDGVAQASKMFSTERIYFLFEKQAGMLDIKDAEEKFIKGIKKEFESIRRKKPKGSKVEGLSDLPTELQNFEERMVAVRYKMLHDKLFPFWQRSDLYVEDDMIGNMQLEDFMFPTTSITKSKKGTPQRAEYVDEARGKSEKIAMIINSILPQLGFTATEYKKLGLLAILPDRAGNDPFYTQDPMEYLQSRDNLISDEVVDEVLSRIDSGTLNKKSVKRILTYVRIMAPLATGRGWGLDIHPKSASAEDKKKAKERTKEVMDKQEKFVESSYRKLFKEVDRFARRIIMNEIKEANQDLNDFAQDVRKIYQEIVEKYFNVKWESK